MAEQTEALRLADALDALLGYRGINADVGKAAAELRRLESVNAQLLEALEELNAKPEHTGSWLKARAAIKAAKGEA